MIGSAIQFILSRKLKLFDSGNDRFSLVDRPANTGFTDSVLYRYVKHCPVFTVIHERQKYLILIAQFKWTASVIPSLFHSFFSIGLNGFQDKIEGFTV